MLSISSKLPAGEVQLTLPQVGRFVVGLRCKWVYCQAFRPLGGPSVGLVLRPTLSGT
jgi:hypothetical protein